MVYFTICALHNGFSPLRVPFRSFLWQIRLIFGELWLFLCYIGLCIWFFGCFHNNSPSFGRRKAFNRPFFTAVEPKYCIWPSAVAIFSQFGHKRASITGKVWLFTRNNRSPQLFLPTRMLKQRFRAQPGGAPCFNLVFFFFYRFYLLSLLFHVKHMVDLREVYFM